MYYVINYNDENKTRKVFENAIPMRFNIVSQSRLFLTKVVFG